MSDQELSFDEPDAKAGPTTCSRCQDQLTEYWAVDGAVVCEECKDELLTEVADPSGGTGRLFKALGWGLLGMTAGAIVWYAVAHFFNLEIGIIAILLGFLVGKGILRGSEGRGGLGYQLMAVAITYLGIGVAMAPFALGAILENNAPAVDSLMTKDADSLSLLSGDSLQSITEDPAAATGASDSALDAELAALDSAIAAGPKGEAPVALGGFAIVLGLLATLVFVLSLPILMVFGTGFSGIISAAIYAFALLQAWSLTQKVVRTVSGPHQLEPAAG